MWFHSIVELWIFYDITLDLGIEFCSLILMKISPPSIPWLGDWYTSLPIPSIQGRSYKHLHDYDCCIRYENTSKMMETRCSAYHYPQRGVGTTFFDWVLSTDCVDWFINTKSFIDHSDKATNKTRHGIVRSVQNIKRQDILYFFWVNTPVKYIIVAYL